MSPTRTVPLPLPELADTGNCSPAAGTSVHVDHRPVRWRQTHRVPSVGTDRLAFIGAHLIQLAPWPHTLQQPRLQWVWTALLASSSRERPSSSRCAVRCSGTSTTSSVSKSAVSTSGPLAGINSGNTFRPGSLLGQRSARHLSPLPGRTRTQEPRSDPRRSTRCPAC